MAPTSIIDVLPDDYPSRGRRSVDWKGWIILSAAIIGWVFALSDRYFGDNAALSSRVTAVEQHQKDVDGRLDRIERTTERIDNKVDVLLQRR